MRKLICPLLAILIISACKKENTGRPAIIPPGSGSIKLAAYYSAPRIPYNFDSQDSLIVAGLMAENNLPANGFDFYEYQAYNALNQNNQMAYYQVTIAIQVRNGLPVFSSDIMFGFENGKLNGPTPAPQYLVGNITLDNKPTQSLQALRAEFIKIDHAGEAHDISIQDSLLVAQLGYYNLEQDNSKPANYIKAWYIHPFHSWPQAFIRDDNAAVIAFQPLTHSGPVHP